MLDFGMSDQIEQHESAAEVVYAPQMVMAPTNTADNTPATQQDKRGWRSKIKILGRNQMRSEMQAVIPEEEFVLEEGTRFTVPSDKLQAVLKGESPDGEGMFSSMVVGYDTRLDKEVMFKIPRSGFGLLDRISSESSTTLYREARLMANAEHPSILKVYELTAFPLDDGSVLPAMITEKASGDVTQKFSPESIADMESHKLYSEISTMIHQVSGGLDYMHRKDMIHRDLKPENIFYKEDPDTGETNYLLADFGLMQGSYREDDEGGLMNAAPRYYAAPEQVVSLVQDIAGRASDKFEHAEHTAKSDQYALAMCALKMLSGAEDFKPFKDEKGERYEFQATEEYLLQDYGLPQEIYNVLLKATSYNQEDRYENCREFSAALGAAIANLEPTVTDFEAVRKVVSPPLAA